MMTQDVIHILNDPDLIKAREYHMDRLERLYRGETLESPFYLRGIIGESNADAYKEPEKWVEESLTNLSEHAEEILDRKVFHPLGLEKWLYGVHFTDRVFGSELYSDGELFWKNGLKNKIGELPVPDLCHNETWKMAQELTLAMVNSGVKLPFFTTQVLGEPWNQLFNLYKEEALVAFYENPDGLRRDLSVVTDTLVQMHEWYLKTIPEEQFQNVCMAVRCQPRGYGQMCGCSTHLISGELYKEFIEEFDDRIFSVYKKGGMYHLCGNHTQHLPYWSKDPLVKAFQVNGPATDQLKTYYEKGRKDQILYVYFNEETTREVTEEKALEITEGGKRCVLLW